MAVKQLTVLPERTRMEDATSPHRPGMQKHKRVQGGGIFKHINDPLYAKVLRLATKLESKTAQGNLLKDVLNSETLLNSKILCSVQPGIGRLPHFNDLSFNIQEILRKDRRAILEIFIEENRRDVANFSNSLILTTNKLIVLVESCPDAINARKKMEQLIRDHRNEVRNSHNKRFEKKVAFHSNKQARFTVSELHRLQTSTNTRKARSEVQQAAKRERIKRSKKRKQEKKKDSLKARVGEIVAKNLVVNLSTQEVPDLAFLYLANGLGFVEAKPCVKEDLTYDVNNFLRKLSWKAFWKEKNDTEDLLQPKDECNPPTPDVHENLRLPSKGHPHYKNALFEEIKTKLKGWVARFNPTTPSSNISPQAERGRAWILKAVREEKIFISKADKGGAILILDFIEIVEKVEAELANASKFVLMETNTEEQLKFVKDMVKDTALELEDHGLLSSRDRELITGLNANKNQKHSHLLKSQHPYAYPLMKLHKLSSEQISAGTTPPMRLIHAQKFGPLYRVEKWLSPYLTDVSRRYCGDEFILDTDDLLKQIQAHNTSTLDIPVEERPNIQLFTLDVEALYPSIDLDMALESLAEALLQDAQIDENTKECIMVFSKTIFDKFSYITCKGKCYGSKKGIATGGCVSRQEADILLHRLFKKLIKPKIPLWAFISLWRRFIDDIFGMWHKRSIP